jgi:hypothetical protein
MPYPRAPASPRCAAGAPAGRRDRPPPLAEVVEGRFVVTAVARTRGFACSNLTAHLTPAAPRSVAATEMRRGRPDQGRDRRHADLLSTAASMPLRRAATQRLATPIPGPARLAIMLGAGQRNQRRIHRRFRPHYHAAPVELPRDGSEQRTIQPRTHQLAAEANKVRAVQRGLMRRETAESAEGGAG